MYINFNNYVVDTQLYICNNIYFTGDQIQPNQTIFINPQNPPPWIQNRMQNQVIYVQQVPNNYYQQQIDPNSVYIQNYPYQVQQQILPQNPQEQRQVQITNLGQNVMQGLPNIHNIANVQHVIQNDRLVERHTQTNNFGQLQQQIAPSRQATPNVGVNQVHNQIPQQTIELVRPGYMNNRPQMAVNANIRQQVVNAPNMPNIQQNIRQTFAPTTNQQRPIQIQNNTTNIQRIVQPTFTNPTQVQTVAKVLESVNTATNVSNNKSTNVTTNMSNLRSVPNYAYRPIQPRPYYRHNVPNIGVLTQPVAQIQNIQSNNNNRSKDIRINNTPNTVATVNMVNTSTRTEPVVNRKRKSESPDEIQKKISIIHPSVSINNTPKQSNEPLKNVIATTATSIVHSETKVLNQNTILQPVNNCTQMIKLVDNGQQTNPIETPIIKHENTYPINPNDKDKLVRNTVFTQARGRLLNDKEIVLSNISVQDSNTLNKSEEELNKVKPLDVVKIEVIEMKNENKTNESNLGTLKDQQEELNKSSLKSDNDITTKEEQLENEINSEQKILTHVLDGYVIQESNMAFPVSIMSSYDFN